MLTGGTGFFGRWLVETFLHANRNLHLGATLSVLSRHPQAFATAAPHLAADPALTLIQGDIRTFPPPSGRYACLIHAATDSAPKPAPPQAPAPDPTYQAIVQGTETTLAAAAATQVARLLYISSGAVYGPQPPTVSHISEDAPQAPTTSPYALGKRQAEALCLASGLSCSIARGFAFLGPHLPLDAHFAAGNFLRDALANRPISIEGDGTPIRSYLYPADLAIWLWTILLRGVPNRAYNTGSDHPISIQALAHQIATLAAETEPTPAPNRTIQTAQPTTPGKHPQRYVPNTQRARTELALHAHIPLPEAIRRTIIWHRNTP